MDTAIGWLAPARCVICGSEGMALCTACADSEIVPYGPHCWNCGALSDGGKTCERCRRASTPLHVWLTTTYENAAQKLLKEYKFGNLRAAADVLAGLMAETFYDFHPPNIYKARPCKYLVVAVPTATSRVRQRSFDHTQLLARSVARKLKFEYSPALARLGQSRQVGASRQDRLAQKEQQYYVRFPHTVVGRHILLIDDVVTTGGTLRAATAALRAAGATRIDALIFAKRL